LRRQVKPASLTAARRRDILTIFGLDEKCEEVSWTEIVKMVANGKRNSETHTDDPLGFLE
jgi:hypothetical protein